MLQSHTGFQYACQARCAFSVSDNCLDGADIDKVFLTVCRALEERFAQRFSFLRIACRSA